MSRSDRKHAVLVGLLVSGGLAVLLGAMLSVGMITEALRRDITVSTHLQTVDGLKEGDLVWFAGVPVGKVDKVALDGPGQVEVVLQVEAQAAEHIPADVSSRLSSDGLIGNRIIALQGGTPNGAMLQDGAELEAEPYVSTDELMAQFQQTNTELLGIAQKVNQATTQVLAGEGTLGKLITDEALYDDASATMASLASAAENADRAAAQGARFAANLNREGTLAHELATDTTTYPAFQRTVAHLETVGAEAADLTAEVAAATRNPDTPIGVLMQDEEAGADLDGTFDHLHESSLLLSQNLEAMQHNILLRGFFKKKEKKGEATGFAADDHRGDQDALADAESSEAR